MLKAASLTVRVKPDTRTRLDNLARITRRSKSYVIEDALEQYLDVNEWQIKGIQEALKSKAIRLGLNTYQGSITHDAVAKALGMSYHEYRV